MPTTVRLKPDTYVRHLPRGVDVDLDDRFRFDRHAILGRGPVLPEDEWRPGRPGGNEARCWRKKVAATSSLRPARPNPDPGHSSTAPWPPGKLPGQPAASALMAAAGCGARARACSRRRGAPAPRSGRRGLRLGCPSHCRDVDEALGGEAVYVNALRVAALRAPRPGPALV